jgi:hypothetical protein
MLFLHIHESASSWTELSRIGSDGSIWSYSFSFGHVQLNPKCEGCLTKFSRRGQVSLVSRAEGHEPLWQVDLE